MDSNPRPTGRPRKGKSLRNHKVTAAFTAAEYQHLLGQAKKSGLKLSPLVSQLAASGTVVSKFSDEEIRKITELRKLYNSVNQMGKALNYFKNNVDRFNPREQEKKIDDILTAIRSILK